MYLRVRNWAELTLWIWMLMAKMASEVEAEIKKSGKVSSAAVFASPEESKKLVRQDLG